MRKIRKNDEVMVLRGKVGLRGQKGKVLEIDDEKQRAKVEGLNLVKKHKKRTARNLKASIEDVPAPIPLSALALVSKKDGKPVRVHFETRTAQGKTRKVRVASRTGEVFE
jgi:large subunit ribosomal protein L24